MVISDAQSAAVVRRPPRSTAWVLLVASAVAVGLTGLAATALAIWQLPIEQLSLAPGYVGALVIGSLLTVASLGLRALRWIFLLRRAETRIPIHDAYVGYLAGFSLLLAPLFLGEIFVRAMVLRKRGGVPVPTTVLVNLWERVLDVAALAIIAGLAGGLSGGWRWEAMVLLGGGGLTLVTPARRALLRLATLAVRPLGGVDSQRGIERLASTRTWLVALSTSLAAWLLPGLALWLLVTSVATAPPGVVWAEQAYAAASVRAAFVLAPAGIVVAGGELMAEVTAIGLAAPSAVLAVFGIRLVTVGVSTLLGLVFVLLHVRTASAAVGSHFDAIADAYDVQIPEARRVALLTTKTEMMREVIRRRGLGARGLDVGCGQGTYVARMRELGFDVSGIDASEGQVRLASRHVGQSGVVVEGSALRIPAPDGSYDFVYAINVLHHLASVEEQQRAFREIARILRPGGALFVHEINTHNALFRFYMGYVFPSLNCIDEGIERWLLAHRLVDYTTDLATLEVQYFTFLPDFLPAPIVRILAPVERWLERSALRQYSAHYMAVLQKPS